MKKVIAAGVLFASVLFTFQPATAATLQPLDQTEATVITAPVVELPVVEPTVTTEPAPVTVVEEVPVLEPVVEPVTVAPVLEPAVDPYSGNPVVDCAAQGLVTAEDYSCVAPTFYTAPEPVQVAAPVAAAPEVITEDDPRWDCATMGNLICGRAEAQALSGYDWTTFGQRYGALQPIDAPRRDGNRYVQSVINPAYVYVFNMSQDEITAAVAVTVPAQ